MLSVAPIDRSCPLQPLWVNPGCVHSVPVMARMAHETHRQAVRNVAGAGLAHQAPRYVLFVGNMTITVPEYLLILQLAPLELFFFRQ